MLVRKSLQFGSSTYSPVDIEEPSVCPLCKCAIKPQELSVSTHRNKNDDWFISATYLCHSCYQTFLVLHSRQNQGSPRTQQLYIEPNRYKAEEFEPVINNLSPGFVKIYNQALAAESSGLDEIAGIGYRKALEFLIKDYLIHDSPDDAEAIKRMALGACIANKVQNERLKTVASRSAWLGNDQTHYVQRFEDRDISDMKNFIKAAVYWVSMELITEDALSMEPQGQG